MQHLTQTQSSASVFSITDEKGAVYDDVRAAELKEMEIPFKRNELSILICLFIVCC